MLTFIEGAFFLSFGSKFITVRVDKHSVFFYFWDKLIITPKLSHIRELVKFAFLVLQKQLKQKVLF